MSLRDYLALQERDVIPYQHGHAESFEAVSRIVLEAGHNATEPLEIGLAYIAIGREDVTVGDVAEAVIKKRQGGSGRLFE